MKNIDIPKIGFRNIKTGISVFLCLAILNFIEGSNASLSCIATIICMGDTIEHTLETSKYRLYGIIIGGIASILFIYAVQFISNVHINTPIIVAVGVSFIIYICNVFKTTGSCTVACVLYISIMFNYAGSGAIRFVLENALYTLIGVIVAIVVNLLIKPPKEEIDNNDNKEERDN